MKILRKKRNNWLKKFFQRLKKIMPEKRKELKNWSMKISNWLSTLTGYRVKTWGFTEELEFQTSKQNKHKQKIKRTKDSSTEGTLNVVEIIGLDLQLLKLRDPNSANSFSIDFSTTNPPNSQPEHGGFPKIKIWITASRWQKHSGEHTLFNVNFHICIQCWMNSYWGRWNVCIQRCMFTYKLKHCASTDLNVHLQGFMYKANTVKIYRFECTLSKMYVHLKSLYAFLIQSWMYTCNEVILTKKDECILEIECTYWPLALGISISKFV